MRTRSDPDGSSIKKTEEVGQGKLRKREYCSVRKEEIPWGVVLCILFSFFLRKKKRLFQMEIFPWEPWVVSPQNAIYDSHVTQSHCSSMFVEFIQNFARTFFDCDGFFNHLATTDEHTR